MIPREELRRWLDDQAAQEATAERFLNVAIRLRALRPLRRLREQLDKLDGLEGQAVLACARAAMMDPTLLDEIFDCLVEAASADPFFRPLMRNVATDIHSGILLFDNPQLTLFLSVMPAESLAAKRLGRDGRRSIVFPGQLSLHQFIRSGGATFSFWEAPLIEAGFTAQGSGRCRLAERRRIKDGELIELDGRRQTFVIDHASSDLVYLQAVASAGRAPLTVEYDSDSFEFVGASSTDEVSSRTQMMLALLRTMERHDAVPLMIAMLDNPNFYARWQAMRELLALDAQAAIPHLRNFAAADPHPEVRAAAAATLFACFDAAADSVAPRLALERN
jgi:hypothetical protein